MIENKNFMEYLKGKLGITLFSDYGEFERSYREHNDVIVPTCGIFRMNPMSVTPLQGLFLASATATVDIAAEVERVASVRALIDDIAASCNGETVTMTDDDGNTYMVTFSYSTAYVGAERTAPNNTGKMIPVSMTVYCSIIQNGVSSCDVKLTLDGEPVFFAEFVASHQRVADSYATEDGTTKAAILQGARSFDFVSPLLSSDLGRAYRDACFGNEGNKAHCFTVEIDGQTYAYIGVFGNLSASAQAPQNVGCNISILEGDPDTLVFDERWTEHVAVGSVTLRPPATGAKNIVFWGDGKTDIWDTRDGYKHDMFHVYADDEVHTVRYFAAQKDQPLYPEDAAPDAIYTFTATETNRIVTILGPLPNGAGGYMKYNRVIEWGDGTGDVYNTMNTSFDDMPSGVRHEYSSPGRYEIKCYDLEEPVFVPM